VAPTLTGLPGVIVSSISAVIQDVSKYLTQVSPSNPPAPAPVSADQKMKAQSLRSRAAAVVAKARAMKR
jgi:hypothetical protein